MSMKGRVRPAIKAAAMSVAVSFLQSAAVIIEMATIVKNAVRNMFINVSHLSLTLRLRMSLHCIPQIHMLRLHLEIQDNN